MEVPKKSVIFEKRLVRWSLILTLRLMGCDRETSEQANLLQCRCIRLARTAQHKLQKQDWAPVVILDSIMVFSTLWDLWTGASGALRAVCVPAEEFNPNTFKASTRASNLSNYKNTKSCRTDLILIEYIRFHFQNKP